ncbi:MAG: TonB-dependent receptor [Catalinimonas sp.]
MLLRPLCLILLLLSASALAQTQPPDFEGGEVEEAEFEVVKSRENKLPPASRNYQKVQETARPATEPQFEYEFPTFRQDGLPDLEPRIRVKTLPKEPLNKLYGNYVKGGVGNYATTYLEGFFTNKRSEDYQYGAQLRHLASARGPVDQGNSGAGENLIKVFGDRFGERANVGGWASYERRRYNFYGYAPSPEPSGDSLKQVFNMIDAGVRLSSHDADAPLQYQLRAHVGRVADFLEARETEFNLGGESRYALSESSSIRVGLMSAFTNRRDAGVGEDSTTSIGRNLVVLSPAYRWQQGDFFVTAGANAAFNNDTANASGFHLYPHLHVDYALVPERFETFAGLTGTMEKVTLRTLADENPFLAPNAELRHANQTFKVYVGARGQLINRFSYRTELSFSNYQNLPFFLNAPDDTVKFDVVYDGTGNTSVVGFNGELTFDATTDLRLTAGTDVRSYGTNQLARPWHRPAFVGGLTATYDIREKIRIGTNLFYQSAVWAFDPRLDEETQLDGLVDLDVRLEYLFSERASAFLNFDNLLNQQNPRYLYYPTRGLMVMAGATYAF